jgi:DNA-binding GntR family transcriptional regulator
VINKMEARMTTAVGPEAVEAMTNDSVAQQESAPRPPLTQRVADRLRDMIVQDRLRPGERIRERDLAERLAVSRTPLREALKILATEGMVTLAPNRGAVVADLQPDEAHDLLQVLAVLEGLAGELACSRATPDDVDEIKALHYEMMAAYARKDRLEYFKINQRIHLAIVAASRNVGLMETHDRINARLYRIRYRSNLRNRKWHTAIEEHQAILDALVDRDCARLGEVLRNHLGSTWAKVSETFDGAFDRIDGEPADGQEGS